MMMLLKWHVLIKRGRKWMMKWAFRGMGMNLFGRTESAFCGIKLQEMNSQQCDVPLKVLHAF